MQEFKFKRKFRRIPRRLQLIGWSIFFGGTVALALAQPDPLPDSEQAELDRQIRLCHWVIDKYNDEMEIVGFPEGLSAMMADPTYKKCAKHPEDKPLDSLRIEAIGNAS